MDTSEHQVTLSGVSDGVEEQQKVSLSGVSTEPGVSDVQPGPEKRETHLGVRYFNYRGFTNRVQNDGWDHTIECLMTGSNPREEVMEDIKRTESLKDSDRAKSTEKPGTPAMMRDHPDDLGDNKQLFKVRIRSAEILSQLAELSNWDADLGSSAKEELVFCRPFHAFYFYHESMKARLELLKSRGHSNTENEESRALAEMELYVRIVEEQVVPLWTRFDDPGKTAPKRVSYEEISFLFRPGDLLFVPPSQKSTRLHNQSAIQTLCRAYFCNPLDVSYPHSGDEWVAPESGRTMWHMYCYDYDGEVFRTAWHMVSFEFFYGEREITSLPCYPLKFHPQRDRILQEHIQRGRQFKTIAERGVQHLYYSGWNLVTGLFEEKEDSTPPEPGYVESEVIIDIKEAERHIPEYIIRDVPAIGSEWTPWDKEEFLSIVWDSQEAQQCNGPHIVSTGRCLMREDGSYFQKATQFHAKNPFFQNDGTVSLNEWTDADFAILPNRIFGYVLRERTFTRLNAQNLESKAESDRVTLDDVQIKDSHRRIVRSSVSSHFMRNARNARNRSDAGSREYDPDIIRGKGRGLVFLLHGAPGVGKTATAEAVALEFNKPLFPITCGDIGITPNGVEETLKQIFRYAHLWDCILLLDEADVFLTQRDRLNIERNALVSVFLRVLEYYSGILFLTTNRVGAFDEAFRSRVHVSLYYPHLSYPDTEAILRNNLKRLPRADALLDDVNPGSDHIQVMDNEIIDFVKDEYNKHYQSHRRGPWNGRQIRNAVQIASCIAFHEQNGRKNLPAVLTREHFKTVHETMTEFDEYMAKAQRVDQAKMAHMQGVRYDRYGEDDGDQEPVEYEGFGGHASDPQPRHRYPASRGSSNAGSESQAFPRQPVPRQPVRQQVGKSDKRYPTAARPATYSSRGRAPYHVASQSYEEAHYDERYAAYHGEPLAERPRTNDLYASVRRMPQRGLHVDNQEDFYHDLPEDLPECADEDEDLSGPGEYPPMLDIPSNENKTLPPRSPPLNQHSIPERFGPTRNHNVPDREPRYRQTGRVPAR